MNGSKLRLELFSDAIFAIIITIAVLEIPLPTSSSYTEFFKSILIFALSFFIIASYWNDHRRLFEHIKRVSEPLVFYNVCFIFNISLIPIFTKWAIERRDSSMPIVLFGVLVLFINFSFGRLTATGLKLSEMKKNILKKYSKFFYLREFITYIFFSIIILVSYFHPNVGLGLFIGMPIMNFIVSAYGRKDGFDKVTK
ncbi:MULTISPECIES: TMEM175 family protein [Enterococcus]|uniref:DUF1211 domain-containing protein n=1 Tax=Enterococcus faecium TaxID=1352 RepID=A0A0D5MB98_ENTFC|nr:MULTISPECIES: TMEM175 family protein [Enterococcus]AJY53609.1 hypothetical protein pEfm12493_125 [Enterococcus faecium]MEC3942695.1 TMEM175 family protein [Enterococcus mundtii]